MKSIRKLGVAALVSASLAVGSLAVIAPDAQAYSSSSRVCNIVGVASNGAVTPFRITGTSLLNLRITDDCLLALGDGLYGNKTAGTQDAVMALQNSMNTCYAAEVKQAKVYPLKVDGKFGNATYAALIKVQKAIGTRADGVLGDETMARMKWATAVPPKTGGSCSYSTYAMIRAATAAGLIGATLV
jgi:peptidoglycan hydrolase-like protein with peptidoglycan-binding domain